MRCLLIDDDLNFSNQVIKALRDEVPELDKGIEHILTEKALQKRLSAKPFDYDVIILDVMVRWTNTNDTGEASQAPGDGGYFSAGIRCLAAIRKLPGGADIPVLIHSARDGGDIGSLIREAGLSLEKVTIFPKDGDFEPLISAVQELVAGGDKGSGKKRR
jgi:CheY-like chemotaxis protein